MAYYKTIRDKILSLYPNAEILAVVEVKPVDSEWLPCHYQQLLGIEQICRKKDNYTWYDREGNEFNSPISAISISFRDEFKVFHHLDFSATEFKNT